MFFILQILQAEIVKNIALIFLSAMAFVLVIGLISWFIYLFFDHREDYLIKRSHRIEVENKASKMVIKTKDNESLFVFDYRKDEFVFISRSQKQILSEKISGKIDDKNDSDTVVDKIDLLYAMDSVQCCLIIGSRDAGKTTILKHFIARRLAKSHVLVLDPHNTPDKWPIGSHVIGNGRDFSQIEKALAALVDLMNKRFGEISSGLVRESKHPKITVVLEEWRTVTLNNTSVTTNALKTLITESRKANIDIFIASQSDRVGALGIKGEGDLKEAFALVSLSVNKLTKERTGTIDLGDGEINALLPGEYQGDLILSEDMPDINLILDSSRSLSESNNDFTDEEQKIIEMHFADESLRSISESVYGSGKFGTYYNDKIKAVIDRYKASI